MHNDWHNHSHKAQNQDKQLDCGKPTRLTKVKWSMQAEEAALLAVDMAAAERRIRSSLDIHISELRQQIESEQRAELSEHIKLQVGLHPHSTSVEPTARHQLE